MGLAGDMDIDMHGRYGGGSLFHMYSGSLVCGHLEIPLDVEFREENNHSSHLLLTGRCMFVIHRGNMVKLENYVLLPCRSGRRGGRAIHGAQCRYTVASHDGLPPWLRRRIRVSSRRKSVKVRGLVKVD